MITGSLVCTLAAESIMSGGTVGNHQPGTDHHSDSSRHRFSTSAKKATSTPPKRKDFMSPSTYIS